MRDCRDCKHLEECYPVCYETGLYKVLNALRRRDLCINDDKQDWKAKDDKKS